MQPLQYFHPTTSSAAPMSLRDGVFGLGLMQASNAGGRVTEPWKKLVLNSKITWAGLYEAAYIML